MKYCKVDSWYSMQPFVREKIKNYYHLSISIYMSIFYNVRIHLLVNAQNISIKTHKKTASKVAFGEGKFGYWSKRDSHSHVFYLWNFKTPI